MQAEFGIMPLFHYNQHYVIISLHMDCLLFKILV